MNSVPTITMHEDPSVVATALSPCIAATALMIAAASSGQPNTTVSISRRFALINTSYSAGTGCDWPNLLRLVRFHLSLREQPHSDCRPVRHCKSPAPNTAAQGPYAVRAAGQITTAAAVDIMVIAPEASLSVSSAAPFILPWATAALNWFWPSPPAAAVAESSAPDDTFALGHVLQGFSSAASRASLVGAMLACKKQEGRLLPSAAAPLAGGWGWRVGGSSFYALRHSTHTRGLHVAS